MDKFRVIVNVILILCVIAVVGGLAWASLDVNEKRTSQCKEICTDKNTEYFSYQVDKRSGDVFCTCLDKGIENKFALVGEGVA